MDSSHIRMSDLPGKKLETCFHYWLIPCFPEKLVGTTNIFFEENLNVALVLPSRVVVVQGDT